MSNRTIGYIRVSTGRQADDGVSLAMQGTKISAYCAFKDLDLKAIYWDPGISGCSIEARPGVQAILELVERKEIDHLVVYKMDRLGRNTVEVLNMIEAFGKADVTFHSLNESIDTESAIGKFFLRIIVILAEMERDLIRERTQSAMNHLKANGRKTGSQAPYGYRWDEEGNAVEDEDEQVCLRALRAMRENDPGLSLRKLSAALANKGCLNRNRKPFDAKNIKEMLEG